MGLFPIIQMDVYMGRSNAVSAVPLQPSLVQLSQKEGTPGSRPGLITHSVIGDATTGRLSVGSWENMR